MSARSVSRPRLYDAEDIAREMRETFAAREVEYTEELSFSWPRTLQRAGDSLAVAYDSDKWQRKNWLGRRDHELFKHLAESRNQLMVRPKLFEDYFTGRSRPVIGPSFSLASRPMPKHFAILGRFLEANFQLYVGGTNTAPKFGRGDDGIVAVSLHGATLGASKIRWSKVGRGRDQPFLFVYTNDGVQMLITGDKLDIERDGIVG